MTITKLKQVEEIAKTMFNCAIMPVDEINAKGYMGVKLIVGQKPNIAFNPKIDPNNPPAELANNKEFIKTVTNPMAPDVRIIWMPPGTTDKELKEKFLLPIKKSLETTKVYEKREENVTKIGGEESDADIAAKIASGESADSRYDDWDEGFEDSGEQTIIEKKVIQEKEEKSDNSEIMEAIGQIAQNMEVLSNDVNSINDTVTNLEGRIDGIEKKKEGKGKKK